MKHMALARSCSRSAAAASLSAVIVTRGLRVTRANWPEAVLIQFQHAFRAVFVGGHHDLAHRAEMQIPEHVAGRKRSQQHVLRIMARGVAQVTGVRGTLDYRLPSQAMS